MAKPKTFAEEGETKRAAPKTFADVELEPGEFEDEPVVKTPTRPAEERLGAAQGHIEEAVAKAQAARAARYEKSRSKEQKAQNLRGDGTSRWPTEVRQHLKPLRRTWEEVKGETGLTIDPWDGKAVGQICKLVDMYSGQEVDAALRYVVGNWNTIKERYKFTGVPTVGVVLACHASLVVEAQEWVKHRSVMEEWARWNEANPDELYPPSELKERYRKAREELSAIGLGG